MVVCNKQDCLYHYKGFCSREFTIIDENAMCKEIWRKGQIKQGPHMAGPAVEIDIIVTAKAKNNGEEEKNDEKTNQEVAETDSTAKLDNE